MADTTGLMEKVITVAQQKGGAGKTTLAVNLAVALARQGRRVTLLDTDPQGSLGRWFMTRREALGDPGLDFSTSSAWGVSYEVEKLRRTNDVVLIDTPPKVDAELRPALREADLILIPVAASLVDLWATDGVLDLAKRENRAPKLVLNRVKRGTRLDGDIRSSVADLDEELLGSALSNRVAFAETLGQGRAVTEGPQSSPAAQEVQALLDEILALDEMAG